MKKNNTLLRFAVAILILLAVCLTASAAKYNGIIAYVEGGQTAYLLEDAPEVTYKNNNAILTVNGIQVAKVDVSGDKALSIVYSGIDLPTSITEVSDGKVKVDNQAAYKIIKDQKIVIICQDGKLYDVFGREVK